MKWGGGSAGTLLALVFLVAGVWKISDPSTFATLLTQLLVPGALSLPLAILLGVSETVAGVFLIVPGFRRWGGWLSALLLIVFVAYIGIFYGELRGKDCSCFPWVKRTVGPGFFVVDAILLGLAFAAGRLARPSEGRRNAVLVVSAVAIFSLVSFGVQSTIQAGAEAPSSISVAGKPYSLADGRVFLYFFDPECSHCDAAAREMAGYRWRDTRLVAIPTRMPQFSGQFLSNSGLKAEVSNDLELLRKAFPFVNAPFGVAIENRRLKATFPYFERDEPRRTLGRLGYVE